MEWNDEAIGRLRAMWDEGLSTAEIGRRLGITKNAVVGKAHRLSLSARPSPIRRDGAGAAPRRAVLRAGAGPTLTAVPKANERVTVRQAELDHSPVPVRVPALVPVVVAPVPLTQRNPVAAPAPALAHSLRAVPPAPRPATRVPACCWPIGEPGTPSFHFCGAGAVAGKPYCAEHVAIAYVKVRDRREDAA